MAQLFEVQLNGGGGGDFSLNGGGGGGGVSTPAPAPAPAPAASSSASLIQYDLSPASFAAARAKGNVESDVRSAYETYITGVPVGRGGTYALDNVRRWGASDIRAGAAAYLDGAGLRRLAQVIAPPIDRVADQSIDSVEDQFFELPRVDPEPDRDDSGIVTNQEPLGEGNPFDTIADVFERVFAVQQPTDTPAPVVVVGDATQSSQGGGGGGSSAGVIFVLLAIGAGAFYWFYWRKRGQSSGG